MLPGWSGEGCFLFVWWNSGKRPRKLLAHSDAVSIPFSVSSDDLGALGHPDHLAKSARCGKQPAETAKGNAVGRSAIERMVSIDRLGDSAVLSFKGLRGAFEFRPGELRRDQADRRGCYQLRIAAPLLMARVDPPLKPFDVPGPSGNS